MAGERDSPSRAFPCGTRSISSAILLVSLMLGPAAVVPAQLT